MQHQMEIRTRTGTYTVPLCHIEAYALRPVWYRPHTMRLELYGALRTWRFHLTPDAAAGYYRELQRLFEEHYAR